MKLSTLVREGAKLHPQAFGRYVDVAADGVHTCALGAAYEALTGRLPDVIMEDDNTVCSTLKQACELTEEYWLDKVAMWNDTFGWSREAIAERLEEYQQ